MRFAIKWLKRMTLAAGALLVALVACIAATFALMRARYDAMKRSGVPQSAAVEPPPEGERSMEEIFSRLEEVPFKPVRPMLLGFAKAAFNNSFLPFLNAARATSARVYPYPDDFEEITIESFDGTPLSVAVGIHGDKPRPAIVMSHGFMGSKNDHYIIDTALKAYAGWGFNVLGIDLRNFGRSQALSHTPTTAGWKEAEDLLAAAKYLSEKPEVTTVGITGFSMGAGSTLRAAYMAREYPYLTGGAIAWNGYSDSRHMIEYISTRPNVSDPFFPVYLSFRLMHRIRREDMKRYIEDPEQAAYLDKSIKEADFTTYVEKIAAPHYGVSPEEYYRNSSSKEYLADVKVPLLVVHAADDPVCPPQQMEVLMEITDDNPNVNVWMLPEGNHCLFMYLDRNWYDSVMRDFFTYWGRWE